MNNYSSLPMGEKLRQIRNAKGLSLENVAEGVNCSVSTVSRIELGQTECSADMLTAIKGFMGIANAPLFEHELKTYENQLYVIYGLLQDKRFTDAENIKKNMLPIKDLPFEQHIYWLSHMIEARWLIIEGLTTPWLPIAESIAQAEEILNKAEAYLETASVEILHIYHRCRGSLAYARNDAKVALHHYLQAMDLKSDNIHAEPSLFYSIGNMYLRLGLPFHAVWPLRHAATGRVGVYTGIIDSSIENDLGLVYTQIGELNKAEAILKSALNKAKSVNDKVNIGSILVNLGEIKQKQGLFQESMELYNQALVWCIDVKEYRLYITSNKALCLFEMKKFSQSLKVVKEGKELAVGDEEFTIMFEAISCLMTMDDKSIGYLENVAIPYFISQKTLKFDAIFFCDYLEAIYKKRGAYKKAYAIATVSRNVYKGMLYGDVDLL